jgi:uncharacterized protein YbjT (DUF2867 family)
VRWRGSAVGQIILSVLITVTGASGRTGRLVVAQLLAAGHEVRGIVRSEQRAAEVRAAGASPVLGDLTTSDLPAVLAGSAALVHNAAASNPTPGASDGVDNVATVALVSAAARAGVQRVVQVSSMYANRVADGPSFLQDVLRSKSVSDAALQDSSLLWTVVRPGGLVDEDATDQVAVGAQLPSGRVSRADVASVCVACLSEPRTECRAFDLTYGATGIADALRGL